MPSLRTRRTVAQRRHRVSALLVTLLLCTASARAHPRGTTASALDVRDAIAGALDYTVTIEGRGTYGAGILVAPAAGWVLTALHVVEEMPAPRVSFRDGRHVVGQVVEVDRNLDLALLRVPPQAVAPPLLGDASRLRPGDEVYAVGCPRHLAHTVSRGIVSYVDRPMYGARYLQTDLPINEGNSGGPVIDARGELVGVMAFILRDTQGLSFAMPVNAALARFPHLRARGAPANRRDVHAADERADDRASTSAGVGAR